MHTICMGRCWSLALSQFVKRGKLFYYKIFSNDFDSLTFINFEENYQTAEIYFYLYHVTPLNITVSNYCVN